LARLEKRRAEIEAKGAKLVAICVDPVEKSKAVVSKRSLGFPILSDPSGETMRSWGVWHESEKIALPGVFVVTRDGKVAWRFVSESVESRPYEDDVIDAVAKTSP
jgi:peroxiredoxin Q/BCP